MHEFGSIVEGHEVASEKWITIRNPYTSPAAGP